MKKQSPEKLEEVVVMFQNQTPPVLFTLFTLVSEFWSEHGARLRLRAPVLSKSSFS